MTQHLDIELVLDDFFDDGHDVFPDHSIATVLAGVDRTAQRAVWRRGVRRDWRTGGAVPPSRILLIAATVGAVVLTGLLAMTGGRPMERDDARTHATPVPSVASRSPSVTPGLRGVTPAAGVAAAGTIVFGVDTVDGSALLAIRPDGSDLHEIQAPPACCAVVSPDGQTVLFSGDATVLLFALGLSLVTGLLFGLAPALRASRPDLVSALKDVTTAIGHRRRVFTLRTLLVVSEVALSLVALVAAALFARSLQRTQAIEPGFATDGVLV